MGSDSSTSRGELARAASAVARWLAAWVPKLVVVSLFGYLALRLLREDTVDPATVGTVLGLAVAALVVLALKVDDVRSLVARVEKFGVGPLSVELARDAAAANRDAPHVEAPETARSLLDLRLRLEAKMAYVAKHLLADLEPTAGGLAGGDLGTYEQAGAGDPSQEFAYRASYLTIGSLHHDKLLTQAQAATAVRILTMPEHALLGIAPGDRDRFLEEASGFVANFRAVVFEGMVRRAITRRWPDSKPKFSRVRGARIARAKINAQRVRVASVFAVRGSPARVATAQAALEGGETPAVIVVPNNTNHPVPNDAEQGSPPPVVRLADLVSTLDAMTQTPDPTSGGAP